MFSTLKCKYMGKRDFRLSCLGFRSFPSPHNSDDNRLRNLDFWQSRNSYHWCAAQDLAENSPYLKKPVRSAVPSRIRPTTLRLSTRTWVSSVFAICSDTAKQEGVHRCTPASAGCCS